VTLINGLLKSKYMLKHLFFFFFLRDLAVWKQNIFLNFLMFWRKPRILIPDLYLYSIQIQTNINQNVVKHLCRKITNFKKKINFFVWAGLGPRELDRDLAKMKSGQNWPKREPTCGWTQPSRVGWVDVPAQNKSMYWLLVTLLSTVTSEL